MRADFTRSVYCLLGLPFDTLDMAGVVRQIRLAVRERRRLFLSTPNVNILIGCRTDRRFRDSVIHSDLSIADGMPLVWIARILGIPVRERIAGSSVLQALGGDPAERISVFFFGGREGVAEIACRRLNSESSGLTCAGFESPGFGSVEDMSGDATIARINAANADFLVVSLGARKGQSWIARNQERLSTPVISHLGAALNFVAGTVARAPAWMQVTGLEWLWRIKEEPALWRRYLVDGLGLLALLLTRVLPYAWYLHHNRPDAEELAAARIETSEQAHDYVVRLRGAWAEQNIDALRKCLFTAVQAAKDLTLDMEDVHYVDSAFVGLVMLLDGHQRQHGMQLLVASAGEQVRRVMKYCCAEYLCDTGAVEDGRLPAPTREDRRRANLLR